MLKSKILSQQTAGENFIVVKRRFLIRCPPWYGYRSSVRIFGFPLTMQCLKNKAPSSATPNFKLQLLKEHKKELQK